MAAIGLTPETFKRLPKDGTQFEAMVYQLLEAMGYHILEKPAVGTEGGRDVLVESVLKNAMVERREKVVIQCKHYAHSGKAIGDNDVGVWENAMKRYEARGYLLVTDTRVTENLSKSFRKFTEAETSSARWADFWDVDKLISHLNQYPQVRDSFFPSEQTKQTPLEELANEVRTWLEVIRYKIEEPQMLGDHSMSMVATLEEGIVKQRMLVHCVGGEISLADVNTLRAALNMDTPEGLLISDKRISPKASEQAAKQDSLRVFTLADFLRQMIWGKYFDSLTSLVESNNIPDLYVDLGCHKQEMDDEGRELGRERHASLETYIDGWLTERGKMHISLLGEFGTGKTWFCRHYAYSRLQQYLKDPANERLPLLITLRAFAKAMTAPQLINDALLEQYKLPLVGSAYDIFQKINQRGKLLLILDGFDEMARQVDYQTVVDNFWELANLVNENSKVILTSRTEYFRGAKESEKILGGKEYGRKTKELKPPKFEVLYLEPFSDDQIREVIVKRLGKEEGAKVAERILQHQNLAEMARKPVLVELLLAALDEVSADVLENSAQVYLYATNKLLLRNITAEKTFTSTADKLFFLCELAWEMIKTNELRIHYTVIPERIKTYFGERIKDSHALDMWDYDLRNQTLLHRDSAGYYEFAHKSLAEYFVAFKFAAELGCLYSTFGATYTEADGHVCEMPVKRKDVIELAETFGAMALTDERMQATRDFLMGVLEKKSKSLWKVINDTVGKTAEQVKYVGGNAATLLRMRNESFIGAKLAGTVLSGADLTNTNLSMADLQNSVLKESILIGCTLEKANLRNVDLTGIQVDELNSVRDIIWSPDGQTLASGGDDGNIWLWRMWSTEKPILLRGHKSRIYKILWLQKKPILASASENEGIFLWNTQSLKKVGTLSPDRGLSITMDSSPDEKYILGGGYDLFVWDIDNQSEHLKLAAYAVYEAKYSLTGEFILVAGGRAAYDNVTFYKASTGDVVNEWKLSPHQEPACIDLLGDNEIITRDWSGDNVQVWKDKQLIFRFPIDGTGARRALIIDNDNKLIFIGNDKHIEIWASAGFLKKEILTGHQGRIIALSISKDKRYLASGSYDNTIRVWDVDPESPTYRQSIRLFESKMNCKLMQIDGAIGTEQKMTWTVQGEDKEGTLLQFFIDRGAVASGKKRVAAKGGRAKAAGKRKSSGKAGKAGARKGRK